MPTRPRREKRIHRQHYEQHCRWILFLWKRKARIRCAREKRGEARRWRSEPRAARREGTESGVVWNEKERRCVVEARGESKKRTRYNLKAHGRIEKQRARNRRTRNRRIKASGPKFERVRGSESESARDAESEGVQFAHHLVEMKNSVDGIALRAVFGVTGHEF